MFSRPEASVRREAIADRYADFTTMHTIRTPRIWRILAIATILGIAIVVAVMVFVPWVQTAYGAGEIVALDPEDRPQPVTAFVPGRVERWFVHDGDLVRKGQPIAKIMDNDPNLVTRLQGEKLQVQTEIAAAEAALATASLNVNRNRQLYAEGLLARRDYEAAVITASGHSQTLAVARAKLRQVDISLDRQSSQVIYAPRPGRMQGITVATGSTYVSAGDPLATIVPVRPVRVLEMFIDGRDVALIHPGRPVRIAFEGWPAIQFSGWPVLGGGLFDGRVRSIDFAARRSGQFRVLVEQAPDRRAWPSSEYLRVGAKARGWIQMQTVSVGYELWRLLNDFPLEFPHERSDPNSNESGQNEPGNQTTT